MTDAELDRFKAQRVTAIHRLDLIARGAQITYEDGTPVDMASERQRLEDVIADMDRRITEIERRRALADNSTDDRATRH